MPVKGPVVHPGEEWAYRKSAVDQVTAVAVTKVGTSKPPRVKVRFLDDRFEGREEWVPPSRLVVEWANVEAWQEMEARWDAIAIPSEGVEGTAEMWAAAMVFDAAVPEDIVCMLFNRFAGVLRVNDPARAADLLGVDPTVFRESKSAFVDEEGSVVVPWTTSQRLAQSAAPKYAEALLRKVEGDERQAAQRAIYGEYHGGRKHSWYTPPEVCAEIDTMWQPVHQLLREWCGTEEVQRRDELLDLRAELLRNAQLVERAIAALEEAGKVKVARSLRDELEVPIQTLRASQKR